jgi:hypothetical protein
VARRHAHRECRLHDAALQGHGPGEGPPDPDGSRVQLLASAADTLGEGRSLELQLGPFVVYNGEIALLPGSDG